MVHKKKYWIIQAKMLLLLLLLRSFKETNGRSNIFGKIDKKLYVFIICMVKQVTIWPDLFIYLFFFVTWNLSIQMYWTTTSPQINQQMIMIYWFCIDSVCSSSLMKNDNKSKLIIRNFFCFNLAIVNVWYKQKLITQKPITIYIIETFLYCLEFFLNFLLTWFFFVHFILFV